MSNPRSASASTSVREQKLARVIDREVAPIWHDRFARMLLRELPDTQGTFVLDVHSGPGHTTSELLQRLDDDARVVALGRDPWLLQVAKSHVRPEWKRRVYFKAGDFDDVTGMGDATYDLSVANLVLGEQVVDWKAALGELLRVTKPGGQVLATLPMHGTWDEVEDLFEELLRDEGMTNEVGILQKLRRRRPKPSHLVKGLEELGLGEHDYVLEHERFELLFRSGREFLFAPVIEHGPLHLWKAILGRAEQPQALFWRFKEVIDTYYAGKVLAVSVSAGLLRIRVRGPGVVGSFSAGYWSRYPNLMSLWRGEQPAARAKPATEEVEVDVDFDLDLDEGDDEESAEATGSSGSLAAASSSMSTPADSGPKPLEEHSITATLPPLADMLEDDPFGSLLDELEAEEAAAAAREAEDAAAAKQARPGKTTLGTLGSGTGGSGLSPLPGRLPSAGGSGLSPLPGKLPSKPSAAKPSAAKPSAAKPVAAKPTPSKPPSTGNTNVTRAPSPPSTGNTNVTRAPSPPPVVPPSTGNTNVTRAPSPPPVVPPSTGNTNVTRAPGPPIVPPSTGNTNVTRAPGPPTVGTFSGKPPQPPKPSDDDPLAAMMQDDDDLEELDLDAGLGLDDSDEDIDDFASSTFGKIDPDLEPGRSGTRRVPPPPPTRKK